MGEKNSKIYISKLETIWSKLPPPKSASGSNSRMQQLLILRHILGAYVDGLTISMEMANAYGYITEEELLRHLTSAVSLLITQAYRNLDKGSQVDAHTEVKSVQSKIQRLERENAVLKNKLNDLQEVNRKQKDILAGKDAMIDGLNDKMRAFIEDRFDTTSRLNALESENEELKVSKKDIEIGNMKVKSMLNRYSMREKSILPYLQETVYCRTYKGKSIGLVPSQIETVIRNHLKGDSNYRISKDMGISKTTITKILSVDYRTSGSLKKILSALHRVNAEGNWGGDCRKELTNLISSYDIALIAATERDMLNREQIKNNIKTLEGFLRYLDRFNSVDG